MKKFIQGIVIVFFYSLYSCSSPTPEEIAISDYVQTIGNAKTDLKFKLIKLELLQDFKAVDSLIYWKEQYKVTGDSKAFIDTLKAQVKAREEAITKLEPTKALLDDYKKKHGRLTESLRNNEIQIDAVLSQYRSWNSQTKPILPSLESYSSNESKVLYKKIKCSYSIENPLLNNAKQEITSVFYFSPDKNKVIGSEK